MPRSLIRSRKAVSGIVGGVFLVVILFVAFNAMIWYYSQLSDLNIQNRNLHLLQQQTELEQLQVINALVTAQGKPNITIQNIGPISVHLVDMFITQQTGTVIHTEYSISYYITPGSTLKNVGLTATSSLNPQQIYSFTFITERGNGVGAIYSPIPSSTGSYATFGNLGYLSVSFTQDGFRYTSTSQAQPIPAWGVSHGSACSSDIFWVTFTNHGVFDAKILHWSMVQMWQFRSGGGGGTATDFYIVGDSSTPNNLAPYIDNDITVLASTTGDYQTGGPSKTILFGATSPTPQPPPTPPTPTQQTLGCSVEDVYDFFIMVSYTYGGQQFNQLTPYASMVVTS